MFDDEFDGVIDPEEWEPIPASELASIGGWDWDDVPGQPQPVPAGMDEPVHYAQMQPLGAQTLSALASVPVELLSQEGLSLGLRQLTLLSRHVDALKADFTAAIAGSKPVIRPDGRVDDYAAHEVAVATWSSVYSADRQVWLARDLATRLTATAEALREGLVSMPQAMALSQAISGLDDEVTAQVEAKVLKFAHRQDTGKFKAALRRWLAKLDPSFTTKAKEARKQCEVTHTPHDDGTGSLHLRGPLEVTQAIAAPGAESFCSHRGHAGLALGWRSRRGASPNAKRGTGASRRSQSCARPLFRGASPLTSPRCSACVTTRRTSPVSGPSRPTQPGGRSPTAPPSAGSSPTPSPGTCSTSATPTPHHPASRSTKNVTSAAPHSSVPAAGCDIEHNQPHHHHGTTNRINCTPVDRRWHRAKTHGGWTYTKTNDGIVTWTSPTGLTCQIPPYDYSA